MENKRKKGFSYWLVNVFWYHYGKLSLLIAVLIILAAVLTVQALQKEKYDLNAVVAVPGPVSEESAEELKELIAGAAGDVDGNGRVNINLQLVDLSDEEHFEDNHYRLLLYLSLPEYTLFFMDGQYSETYSRKEGYFNELAGYGIETSDPTGKRIYVGDKKIMKAMGGYGFYACLSDWTTDGKGDRTWTEAAVRALKALLSSPE